MLGVDRTSATRLLFPARLEGRPVDWMCKTNVDFKLSRYGWYSEDSKRDIARNEEKRVPVTCAEMFGGRKFCWT